MSHQPLFSDSDNSEQESDHEASSTPREAHSLVAMCRMTICMQLERYPPEAFAVLSEEEFEAIVQLRHFCTSPESDAAVANGGEGGGGVPQGGAAPLSPPHNTTTSNTSSNSTTGGGGLGAGGLDGTGRMIPAINVKTIKAIESANPHLTHSSMTDVLIWKDCVEYTFTRRSEQVRPIALRVPWPHLVKELQDGCDQLMECWEVACPTAGEKQQKKKKKKKKQGSDASPPSMETPKAKQDLCNRISSILTAFREAPVTVDLLTASGIGKTVHKFTKACAKRQAEVDAYAAADDMDEEDGEPQSDEDLFCSTINGTKNNNNKKKKQSKTLNDVEKWILYGTPLPKPSATTAHGNAHHNEAPTPVLSLAEKRLQERKGTEKPPLVQMQALLQGWKSVASASGVKVTKKNNKHNRQEEEDMAAASFSGQGKKTTQEQHLQDLKALKKCTQWRHLFHALEQRRETMKLSYGALARRSRTDLHGRRGQIKSCLTVQKQGGQRPGGMGGTFLKRGGNAGGQTSKMKEIHAESKIHAAFKSKKGLQQRQGRVKEASVFGCAVATSLGGTAKQQEKKRAMEMKKNEVAMTGGKRIKMPSRMVSHQQQIQSRSGSQSGALKRRTGPGLKYTSPRDY